MNKILTAALCAASMSLASCATMPAPSAEQAAQIGTAISRARAAYDRIAASAELVLAVPLAGTASPRPAGDGAARACPAHGTQRRDRS